MAAGPRRLRSIKGGPPRGGATSAAQVMTKLNPEHAASAQTRDLEPHLEMAMYARILVPVDASAAAAAGFREALRLAHRCRARLRLVHVLEDLPIVAPGAAFQSVPEDAAQSLLLAGSRLLTRLRDEAIRDGAQVDYVLVENSEHRPGAIVNEQADAWKAELIVMGTHGRHGAERFLEGSVAEQVVRHADVPVLLVTTPDS